MWEQWLEGCWSGCEWSWNCVGVGLDGGGGFGEGLRSALTDCHLWAVRTSVRRLWFKGVDGLVMVGLRRQKVELRCGLIVGYPLEGCNSYGWSIVIIVLMLTSIL